MGSTYLRRPCKPWPRFDRDTCRVNESPREAREHFASRLKGWVRFRPRMFFLVFCFCFKKNESPPSPLRRASRLKAWENQNAPRPSKHAPVRGCQNKRLGGTIGYYYDKGVHNM